MKLAFFELEDWEKKYFEERFKDKFECLFFDTTLNHQDLTTIKDVEMIVIFINSQINKEVLDTLPSLKSIFTMSTGVDHIDVNECKKRNITVSNVPVYGENTVAEHAFALILAI